MVHLCCDDNRMESKKITTAEFNAILQYVMNHQVTLYREQVLQIKILVGTFKTLKRVSVRTIYLVHSNWLVRFIRSSYRITCVCTNELTTATSQ